MEYILVPSQSKTETTFLMEMFRKMNKQAAKLSAEDLEDIAFTKLLRKANRSGNGSLEKVKEHLTKVSNS